MKSILPVVVLASVSLVVAGDGGAVVSQNAEVPFQNTTASGLVAGETAIPDWIATLNGFLVTAVAPSLVLAARHIFGGSDDGVGATVVFENGPNAGSYTTIAAIDDPEADLRLLEIDGVLSTWAALYEGSDEEGQTVTIFGRGPAAGPAVILDIHPLLMRLKGWKWGTGPPSDPWSWGRNIISATFVDPARGPVLEIEFNRGPESNPPALPNECHLSGLDSSGPWFVADASGEVALAGVSTAVLGPFRITVDGPSFQAMILDMGGLFLGSATTPFPDLYGAGNDFPSTATGVRISERLAWLSPLLLLVDADGDGFVLDNCTTRSNPSQLDTDGDGFGNACDCDFDQVGTCNIGDFNIFVPDFITGTDSGTGTDMDGSGRVNIGDFNLFVPGFQSGFPGPSAFAP